MTSAEQVSSGPDPSTAAPSPIMQTSDPVGDRLEAFLERLEQLETRSRQESVQLPVDGARRARPVGRSASPLSEDAGRWAALALTHLAGERVPELELRALADVLTTGNLGVVPDSVRTELVGIIDPSRPFLDSTRQVPAGDSGLKITFPRIVQRPITGKQATEKAEVASRATIIDTVEYGAITIAGAGDLSIQLLRRSSPSFLNVWLELLAESYAINADNEAVDVLLASGVQPAGAPFDPGAPVYGEAFRNAAEVGRPLRPDRVWMSTDALVAFIDAKTPAGGGGAPLYPGLVALGGISPTAAGVDPRVTLQPVWVPALDDELVDMIIGPSRGFAWAEDGTFTLQADVPAKMGRDVGLGGMLWYMPIYPAAFTTYTLAP